MAQKERQSNVELLRILAICGVIVLHFNGYGGFSYAQSGTVNYWVLLILESLCICAVDLFILISGYFLCASGKRRIVKALELVLQVVVIRLIRYALGCLLGLEEFRLISMIGAMVPNNYFVTMYLALYFLSPYINLLLEKLTDKQLRNLLVLWLALFSLWPTVLDVFSEVAGKWYSGMYPAGTAGSQYGYNMVHFVTMYLLGAYLRKNEGKVATISAKKQTVAMVICVAVLTLLQTVCPMTARSYCNPLVIAMAVLIFAMGKRLSLRSKLVNTLAKSALTCFLFHDFLLPFIIGEKIVTGNTGLLLLYMLLAVVGLYLLCWLIWCVYETLSRPVRRWLGEVTEKADAAVSVQNG